MKRLALAALGTLATLYVVACTDPARPRDPAPQASAPTFGRSADNSVTITELGSLGDQSIAYAISDAGEIVGRSQGRPSWNDLGTAWTVTTPGGTTATIRPLQMLPGGCCSSGTAVNGVHIAGWSKDASGAMRNVFWTLAGEITERVATNGIHCGAAEMNALGQVAGSVSVDGVVHPCIWTPDAPNSETGTTRLLALPPEAALGGALGLNNRGDVVGYIKLAGSGHQRAYVWWADGTPLDLGCLPGGTTAYGQSINDQGEVAGDSYASVGGKVGWRAYVWTAQRGMLDLGAIGPWAVAKDITNVVDGVSYVIGHTYVSTKMADYNAALWTITHDANGDISGVSVRDLGRPKNALRSNAYSLSNAVPGVVQAVGYSTSTSLMDKATLWTVKVP